MKRKKKKTKKKKRKKKKRKKKKRKKKKTKKKKRKKKKRKKKKRKKKKRKKEKEKRKYNRVNEISDFDDLNEDVISDDEKYKLLLQVQEIKNKLSISSKYITKYYENADTGLLSNSKELKNNLKEISFFTNIQEKSQYKELSQYIKEEIDKINNEIQFIDNKIINNIFNDSDGLLKSIDNVENNFDELKKLVSNNDGFLKVVFDNNENNRLELIHNIEEDLAKLDNKFRTNINNYYQNIKDVQSILKNLTKKIESLISEGDLEKDKLAKKIQEEEEKLREEQERSYREGSNYMNMMGRYYDKDDASEKKEKEIRKKYDNDKKNLVNKYKDKLNDLMKEEDYKLSNINSKLNIEKVIFDNYKYNIYDSLFKKLTNIENKLTSKKITNIKDTNYTTNEGNQINFNENSNDNIFSRIWNKYVNNIMRNNKTKQEIDDDFYNSVKVNDLNPEKVLEINNSDKIIFIVLIFVIRQISLLITNLLIDYDIIKSFNGLIIGFVLIYIIILFSFIVIVNLDNYKMRILFNYINLHINYYGITTHIFTFILFIIIIYTYIKNTDKNLVDDSNTKLSEEQKSDYKYKLSTISLIVYLFTSIADYLL